MQTTFTATKTAASILRLRTDSEASYRERVERVARTERRRLRESTETLVPYVNHGRWVANCPEPACNGGIAIDPEMGFAACLDCCTTFTRFAFLQDPLKVDAALAERREVNRNWLPTETVQGLTNETALRTGLAADDAAFGLSIGSSSPDSTLVAREPKLT